MDTTLPRTLTSLEELEALPPQSVVVWTFPEEEVGQGSAEWPDIRQAGATTWQRSSDASVKLWLRRGYPVKVVWTPGA